MSLLKAVGLSLGYDSQTVASDIDFDICEGYYVSILGENGAGKSTLVKTILGLQKPVSGKIERGDGISKNDIGYLPQQTVLQKDFPASVWEIVLSGRQCRCGLRPFYNKKDKFSAADALEKMGITELKDKSFKELSGGQQQRVKLARALCAAQKILILDEPVTGLDPMAVNEFYELIKKLNRDGLTIIMVSHDIEAALRYSDHILHIGETSFYGTLEQYRRSEAGKSFILTEVGS